MIKLDLKDRRILYELNLDSRQSFSKIGKKVGLHRNNVLYRVNNLIEKGVIKYFFTVVDSYMLGYTYLRFYITFYNISPQRKKEIIDYFVKCTYTTDVYSTQGSFDLCLIMAVKNINEFYYFWKSVLNKYGKYFVKNIFSIYCSEKGFPASCILEEEQSKKNRKQLYEIFDSGKKVKINEYDLKILELIGLNSRLPTKEIALKLNSTTNTVKNRIKRLRDTGIIRGFKVNIDLSKLNYKQYKVDIFLTEHQNYSKIVNFIEKHPNLHGVLETIGYADIEFVFWLTNADEVIQIMDDLYSKYPETIRNYTYFCCTKTHKWIYFPES